MRILVLLPALLGACLPVEIAVGPDGRLAYPVAGGFALAAGLDSAPTVVTDLLPDAEEGGVGWLRWSPDGRSLAVSLSVGENDLLLLWDPGTGRSRRVAPAGETPGGRIYLPRFSPDGTRLSYALWKDGENAASLRVVDVATGRERELAQNAGISHAWSPDGKSLLAALRVAGSDPGEGAIALGSVARIDAATGAAEALVRIAFDPFVHVDLSPDGRRIWFCAGEVTLPQAEWKEAVERRALFRFEPATKRLLRISGADEAVAWSAGSADGRRRAFVAVPVGAQEGTLCLHDAEEGATERLGPGEDGNLPVFAGDGSVLFSRGGAPIRYDPRDKCFTAVPALRKMAPRSDR